MNDSVDGRKFQPRINVSHEECQPWGMSAMRNVSHEECQPLGMSAMRNVSHEECQLWGMSAMRNVSHEERQLWGMSAMRNVSHEECKPWRMYAMRNVSHDECQPWGMSAMRIPLPRCSSQSKKSCSPCCVCMFCDSWWCRKRIQRGDFLRHMPMTANACRTWGITGST